MERPEQPTDSERWLERLSLSPVTAPMPAEGAAGRMERLDLELPDLDEAETVALFASWLARMSGNRRFALGVFVPELAGALCAEGARRLSGFLPLGCDLQPGLGFDVFTGALRDELTALRDGAEDARAVLLALPELREPEYPCQVARAGREPPEPAALRLVLPASGQAGRAQLAYGGAYLDGAQAARLRARLQRWAGTVTADRQRDPFDLPIVDDAERAYLVDKLNQTRVDYPGQACVHTLISEQARRTPEAIAVVFRDRSLTYAELERRANRLAHALVAAGVARDQLVGLCLERSEQLVVAALAIWKAGGAYVPLDPDYPPDRLALMAEDSGARLVLCEAATSSRVPRGAWRCIQLDDPASPTEGQPDHAPAVVCDSAQLAYAIYTSGSTGKPKGVLIEHRNVVNFFTGMDAHIGARDGSTWLAVTSLSFDISVLELFWTLARGFKVVIASADRSDLGPEGAAHAHADRKIDFSLFYFAADSDGPPGPDKYRLLIEGARFADTHGFVAVSTPERHFAGFGGLYPNPSVAAAALAMVTSRVQLRAGSCVLPLHHPARVAEEWALVDNLSNGRVGISFAAGWHPRDFLLLPGNFADKKNVMVRHIDVVRRLWRGEQLTFDSPVGPTAVEIRPRPVQRELPVWVTAAGNPETFAAAGRLGANLLTHLLGQSFDEMASKLAVYRQAWREAGHPGEGTVTLMLHTFVGPDASAVKEIVRGPMKAYLKSSLELIGDYAWSFPAFKRVARDGDSLQVNFERMTPEEMDALLEFSFERYYETSGLFGTPDSCAALIDRLKGWGVDDVACLIDFGIDTDTVLAHLPYLDELRRRTSEARKRAHAALPSDGDYSLSGQIVRHGVTHLQCTPSMARMLVEHDAARAALAGVRHLMIGGEALPPALVDALSRATSARITNMYGPTETTIWSSVDEVRAGQPVTIGRPIANTTFYVLDGNRALVPPGAPGELCIGGDGVARGYHARAELTAERFLPDPFRPGERIYRTGDLVRYRDDGRVEYLGRIDNQVKLRGFRIELGEIEARLAELPGVREAVVLVREDRPGDPRLVAYLRADTAPEAERIRQHLHGKLPEYMIPAAFVTLQQFPLTPNKKVDRKALPPPADAAARAEYAAPEGEIEDGIVRVFQQVLGLEQVGRDDNFFQLGGHSLLAVQAHRKLREVAPALSVTDLFRFPTARQLAAHLGAQTGSASSGADAGDDRAAARRAAMTRRRRGREGGGSG